MTTQLFSFTSLKARRFGALLLVLAMLMQMVAMPVSAVHMATALLQSSVGKVVIIPICSSQGTTYETMTVKGEKPLKPQHLAKQHCQFCLVGGGTALPVVALNVPDWYMSAGPLWPLTPALLAERDFLWPPGRGPPLA